MATEAWRAGLGAANQLLDKISRDKDARKRRDAVSNVRRAIRARDVATRGVPGGGADVPGGRVIGTEECSGQTVLRAVPVR